ncbi:hypothetical protein [Parafrankia sp. EUN1f]|uniref:hypothetical protein n=1 Tax=Parafrankia sp. EUN1f TaxID=102897 RepID=UPI0001C45A9F|nr:hypothetical protein [Parafrankia sp. EUN1f]EFC81999.1 hypothetical protein FrEUN1fDRAFT_4880 [Parafrankia sp. EUN1f]
MGKAEPHTDRVESYGWVSAVPFGIVTLIFLWRTVGDRPVHGKHGKISSGALALVFTGVTLNALVGALEEKHGAAGVALTLLGLACLVTAVVVWVWQGGREGPTTRTTRHVSGHWRHRASAE